MGMIAPTLIKKSSSRWMDWQPKPRIIVTPTPTAPTEPSKPGSVGFVGCPQPEVSIKRGHLLEQVAPQDDTTKAKIAELPPEVHLIEWSLKEPPVAIETCAVVTDSDLFARTTLEQLRIALVNPKRWVGWTVPQLIDRLAQVGVRVTIEPKSKVLDTEGA
jgi:hypothetical protein